MSTPQPPSADQLAAARLTLWRQNAIETVAGISPDTASTDTQSPDTHSEDTPPAPDSVAPILTIEAARQFVSNFGLVLFSPRSQHINSPAPSLVEATLAVANPAPTVAASATARHLLARLIAEGSAVPLNLLGAPSTTPDAPDFIASAATFPYIFTLRGDKAWKQPPATSGPTKVTPLAVNTYTLIVENGASSASGLANLLGKEITEAAVLRALNELWQHLRVLPVPSADGGPTLWEPVQARFTKQLKAGANAGQPTALSALISLYLAQALLATEADIETFLSPLAPRSRVRDVLHALLGARQLETIAVDGKTHLHLHGDLPTFASLESGVDASDISARASQASGGHTDASTPGVALAEDGTRIRKFVPRPRKVGTGYVERARPFGGSSRPARESRSGDRPGADRGASRGPGRPGSSGRPGTPARSAGSGGFGDRPQRPAFNKPWEEEKQARADRSADQMSAESPSPQSPSLQQSSPSAPGGDVDLDAAASASGPTSSPARPFPTRPTSSRPPSSRPSFDSRAPRRPFSDRARSAGGSDRPSFSRGPGSDRAGSGFDRAGSGGSRPGFGGSRPAFSRKPPFGGDSSEGESRPPRREFTPRDPGDTRPPRREFSPGAKPSFGDRKPSFSDRKPSFSDRKPSFGDRKPSFGDRKPFGKPSFGARRFDGSPNTGPDRSQGRTGDSQGRTGDSQDRSAAARPPFNDRERRPFRREESAGDSRPPRREFTPRADAPGRPPRDPGGFSKPRTFRDREPGAGAPARPAFRKFDAPRKPFTPRDGGDTRPDATGSARPSFGDRKPFNRSGSAGPGSREGGGKREGPGSYAGKREGPGSYAGKREGAGSYAGKREGPGSYAGKREGPGGSGGKKTFSGKPGGFAGKKPFSAKPSGPRGADAPGASTFDKFKGGNKPWGKRPPGRKPKTEGGEA